MRQYRNEIEADLAYKWLRALRAGIFVCIWLAEFRSHIPKPRRATPATNYMNRGGGIIVG